MKKIILSILTISFLVFVSCKKAEKSDNTPILAALGIATLGSPVSVIPFTLVSDTDTAFGCAIKSSASDSTNFYLVDARLFIHDVKLVKADGSTVPFTLTADGVWQTANVALLDFENKTGDCTSGTTDTNTSLRGTSPTGNYVGVEFKIGVPSTENNLLNTTATAPLNVTGMYWSWTSGYKFAKIEWNSKEGAGTFNRFHLGGGTCTGSGSTSNLSCALANIPTVSVKTAGSVVWSPSKNPVYLDIKTLANNTKSNLSNGGAALTCMAGNASSVCKPLLNNVGINEADGKSLTTQSAFYLKP